MGDVRLNGTATVTPSASSVGSSQITDGSIVGDDIADQSIPLAKLSRTGATTGKVLTGNGAGSSPSWETPSSSPTTTRGDMIVRGASADVRLAVGSSGQVLGSNGTDPAWVTPPASSPTTTRGDLIRRGASADERLALGTSGQVLSSNGTDAVWSTPSAPAPAAGDVKTYAVTISATGGASWTSWTAPVAGRIVGVAGCPSTATGGTWRIYGASSGDTSNYSSGTISPANLGQIVFEQGVSASSDSYRVVTASQTKWIYATGGAGQLLITLLVT